MKMKGILCSFSFTVQIIVLTFKYNSDAEGFEVPLKYHLLDGKEDTLLYEYRINKYGVVSYDNGQEIVELYGYNYSLTKSDDEKKRICVDLNLKETRPGTNRPKAIKIILDQAMAASFSDQYQPETAAIHIDYINRDSNDCSLSNLRIFYNLEDLQHYYIEKINTFYLMNAKVCTLEDVEDAQYYIITSEGPIFSLKTYSLQELKPKSQN